jgi:hypothetical protein
LTTESKGYDRQSTAPLIEPPAIEVPKIEVAAIEVSAIEVPAIEAPKAIRQLPAWFTIDLDAFEAKLLAA